MSRKASREFAMRILFQLEIQKDDQDEQIENAFEDSKLEEKDKLFARSIIEGVRQNALNIDKAIEKYSKGWKLARISKIELSILRISIHEVTGRSDIPFNVSVNEAVELAKKYSGKDAASFVNGVLSSLGKEIAISAD